MLFRITDHPDLVKDSNSKAVLNTDLSAVRRHEERLTKVNKEVQRERDINQLKGDVGELKSMLRALLEKVISL
jgi:hypothetical protein